VAIPGRLPMSAGALFKVSGVSGTFRFMEYVVNTETGHTWISAYGGDTDPNGRRQWRAFAPSQVSRVLRPDSQLSRTYNARRSAA
jgi:hypothetical protein